MQHVVGFSGGKDSTALVLHLQEQGLEFETIFCDTGWEHPVTYAYIEEINQRLLGGKLHYLQSEKYDGFLDLVTKRKMVPGVHSRFCTQELKVFPLHRYLETLDDGEITVYQGIRADESLSRSKMPTRSWEPGGGGFWIERPLLHWTAKDVFALAKKHGIAPNPLYLMGAKRVGCWPCIMVSKRELKSLMKNTPEIVERVIDLERTINAAHDFGESPRTFFRYDYIPPRFHYDGLKVRTKLGKLMSIPTANDVFRYLREVDEDQLPLIPAPSCMSHYNLCE